MNLLILTQKVDKNDDNLGFFHRWLEKFAERTNQVFVIANFAGEHSLPANAQIFSLGKEKKFGRVRRYFNFYRYLFKLLSEIDAIFVHMIPAWVILVWPVAFIFQKKIYLWYAHKSITLSLRVADNLATKVFTSSKGGYRLNSKKLVMTGQGIDVAHFEPKNVQKNPAQLKFLSVGRISESKNFEFLIDVAEILKNRGLDFIFNIVGMPILSLDFSYKKKLENLIAEKKLQKNIHFLGVKIYNKMPQIYNSHDILIHASKTGSLDKVVLEAMSCGLPIITTSEAFVGTLDVLPKEANLMAEKIIQLKNAGKNLSLREIVVQNHNLSDLIKKIMENL